MQHHPRHGLQRCQMHNAWENDISPAKKQRVFLWISFQTPEIPKPVDQPCTLFSKGPSANRRRGDAIYHVVLCCVSCRSLQYLTNAFLCTCDRVNQPICPCGEKRINGHSPCLHTSHPSTRRCISALTSQNTRTQDPSASAHLATQEPGRCTP